MSQVQQAVSALDPEPGVVAHASYYIQCHVKAATFSGSVHGLYVAGLNPEVRGDDALVCCPTYNCDDVVAKAWHAQHHDDNIDILAKLVRKGGPAPSSVRYVGGLMKRCALMSRDAARVIRLMLASHFLGGYQNSLVCADPAEHIRFLNMTTNAMLEYATTNSSTRQLHAIVSTFVSANTQASPPLLWSVGPAAALHAAGVASGRLRAFGRSTPAAPVTPYSRIIILMKALSVRGPPADPVHLSPSAVIIARSAVGIVSPYTLLVRSGIASPEDLKAVYDCTQNHRYCTLKAMRMVLKKIKPDVREFLVLALSAAARSARLVIQTTPLHVQQAQKRALVRNNRVGADVVPFCTCCCTFRSHINGVPAPRARSGVSVDMVNGVTICNNCGQSKGIIDIVLSGRTITLLGRGMDMATSVGPVTLCTRCSLPAVSAGYFGAYPHCKACLSKSHQDISRPQPCVCCGSQCTYRSMWCEVTQPGGGVGMAWFCRAHASDCPDHVVSQEELDAIHGTSSSI